jgi:hypothetical protein
LEREWVTKFNEDKIFEMFLWYERYPNRYAKEDESDPPADKI